MINNRIGYQWPLLVAFLFSTALWADISDCPPFEGGFPLSAQQREIIAESSCQSCRCIQESFIDTDFFELDSKYRSELKNTLILRFQEEVVPEFVTQMKEFEGIAQGCQMDRINDLSCQSQQLRETLQLTYDRFLNRHEVDSCFPPGTIEKYIGDKLNQEKLQYISRLDENNSELDLSQYGPILSVYLNHYDSLSEKGQNYQELKEYILTGDLRSDLVKELDQRCDSFFDQMETVFCDNPTAATSREQVDTSHLYDITDEQDIAREYEIITLQCLDQQCHENDPYVANYCHKREEVEGFDLDDFFSNNPIYTPQSQNSTFAFNSERLRLNEYCPLLECESTDAGINMIFSGGDTCQEASPKRTLEALGQQMNCGGSQAHEICEFSPVSDLMQLYDSRDEPLPDSQELLGNQKLEELDSEERKEILSQKGYSSESLSFLGESGIQYSFGQDFDLQGRELSTEEREFNELGRDQALTANSQRQEKQQNRAEQEFQNEAQKRQEQRQQALQRQRQNKNQRDRTQEKNIARPIEPNEIPEREVVEANQQLPTSNYSSLPTQRFNTGPVADDYRELEKELRNLEREAQEIRTENERDAYERRISQLQTEIDELRDAPAGQIENRTAFTPENTSESTTNRNNEVLSPDSDNRTRENPMAPTTEQVRAPQAPQELNQEQASFNNGQRLGDSASQGQNILSSQEDEAGVQTRTLSSSGELAAYLERDSEEMALFSLEGLDEVQLGESFILGVKEGEETTLIEMLSETEDEETYYRLHTDEELSADISISIAKSPFLREHLHPESKSQLLESVRNRVEHSELIKLLEF